MSNMTDKNNVVCRLWDDTKGTYAITWHMEFCHLLALLSRDLYSNQKTKGPYGR
jgi:hypothetical protein